VSGRPAAFIDRDGTLNEFVSDPDSGLPGVATEGRGRAPDRGRGEGGQRARERRGSPSCACPTSRQRPRVKVSLEQLLAVHERVLELLGEEGVNLDAFRLCLHHPQGVVPELSGPCACRKPAPGMLLDAAQELGLELASSWMLGDTDSDVVAAHAAAVLARC